ncbi:MAG TPA: hypothetical protein VJ570_03685 [Holophagaceae bacterium]|nr:hypothetical protein [Holophagaceae bacterium]
MKAVKIIRALDLVGLHAHPGLNFEKLVNLIDPVSKQPLYSFRFGKGHRAICTLETGPLVVVGMFIADHGKAYRP